MARELSYSQLMEVAQALDSEFAQLRTQAKDRYALYSRKLEPYVPDEIAREGKMRLPSAMLDHAASTIRADIMMNPTEFTCIPLARQSDNTIATRDSRRAEVVERATAVIWGKLNDGRRIDRDVIWHQLVSPFAVMVLEVCPFEMPEQPEGMEDADYAELVRTYEREWMPWHISLPDPMTCSFLEKDGKPTIFVRRFKMLVRDVEDMYSYNRSAFEPDMKLAFKENAFQWVSDDYEPDATSLKSGFMECTLTWMDDGHYIYLAADNTDAHTGGMLLSCTPNPIGRCTAFIVPGNLTAFRRPEDRYEPFLLPLMQSVKQLNDIRSMRATAARNLAGPNTYISVDPEIAKLYIQKGESLPRSQSWVKNETPYIVGEVKTKPSELSQDWDKIEQVLLQEQERFLPSPYVNVIDPDVIKSATATSILHAAESGMRMYGPLMSVYDAAIKEVMDAIITTIRRNSYDSEEDPHPVYAYTTGEELVNGKNLSKGEVYRLDQKSVNFSFKLMVKTRSMSQAQAAAQYDLVLRQWVLPDGSKGPATLDDVIDAANYTDREAQKIKLAKESIMFTLDPWIKEMAIQAARRKIELQGGPKLPIGPQNDMGGAGAPPGMEGDPSAGGAAAPANQPASIPGGAQRMEMPLIAGPSGGSEASMMGGTAGGAI